MPIQKMKKPERGEKVSGSLAFSPSSESKGWNRRIEEAQVQELRLFLPNLYRPPENGRQRRIWTCFFLFI